MGSTEKFCLRWNDFESNISSAFRDLRSQKDFFDVTLAVDDDPRHALQAHKVILSACSPFFRNALLAQAAASPLAGMVAPMIYLRGVTYEDLKHVLDFMYHGEVNVAQDDLNSFLAVAEDLKIKGLTQNEGGGQPTPARSFKASSAGKREPPDRGGENGSAKKRPRPQPVPGTSRDDDSGEPSVKAEPSGAGASGGAAGEDDFGDGGGDYGDDYGDYEGDMSYGGGEGDESMGAAMGGTDDAKARFRQFFRENVVEYEDGTCLCMPCDKRWSERKSIYRHVRDHHVEKHLVYDCPICGKVSKSKNSFYTHLHLKHPESKGQFKGKMKDFARFSHAAFSGIKDK